MSENISKRGKRTTQIFVADKLLQGFSHHFKNYPYPSNTPGALGSKRTRVGIAKTGVP